MYVPFDTEKAVQEILAEYRSARTRFAPMHSAHEGYAVILEELEEAWAEIKASDNPKARKEMIQVGAMVLAFLVEVGNNPNC